MPFVIELQLRASWPVQPDTRQLHGLACALFEGAGADHLGRDKPFTVRPLRKAPGGGDRDWELRAAWLPGALPPPAALSAEHLRYGHVTCAVAEARQRHVSYAQLAAGPAVRAVRVSFTSPTYFSQNGTRVVLPDPRLIAGSWRRRWNKYLPAGDPLAIGDDAWRDTHQALSLTDFELATQRRESGYSRGQPGMTGWLDLKIAGKASPAVLGALGTLARFAEFCGTGAQTTHGFGATSITTLPRTPDG